MNNFDKFDEVVMRIVLVMMCIAGLLALVIVGVLLFRAFSGIGIPSLE